MKEEKASSTAILIAASLVLLKQEPDNADLVSDASADFSARVLETHSFATRLALKLLRQLWFRPIATLIEQATIPGIARHYALRKNVLRQIAQEALTNEIKQVVILGAGFDALTLELERKNRAIRFWEIDHPATQTHKVRCLTNGQNIHFIAIDMSTKPFPTAELKASGFDPNLQTCWIAEGLLMYFHESTVRSLLASIGTLSAPGSVFACTFMNTASDGSVRFQTQTKLVDWWLGWRGEPFLWGSSPQALSEILRSWRDVTFFDDYDLRCKGEVICRAQN